MKISCTKYSSFVIIFDKTMESLKEGACMNFNKILNKLFPKGEHITKSLLLQYLISYIIILFVPLIILVLFIQFRFQSALIEELQTNSRYSLSTMSVKTEQKIDTYQRIARQLSVNKQFQSPLLPSNPNDYLMVKEEMNSYSIAANTPFVAVYWEGSDFLFSNIGSSSFRLLSDEMQENLSTPSSDVQVFLSNLYPANQSNQDFIIYKIPFITNYSSPEKTNGYLLFGESYEQFSSNLPAIGNFTLFLYACNKNGEQIYGDSHFSEIQNKLKTSGINPFSPASLFVLNEQYLLNIEHLETGDLTFYSFIPTNQVLEKASELRTETILVITLTFILASILIIVMIRYNYSPVHRLLTSMEHLFNKEQKNLNRIEAAKQVVCNLEQQNLILRESSKKYTQDDMLRRLLDGSGNSDQLKEDLSSCGIVFDKPYFCVCCIQMETNEISYMQILTDLREQISVFSTGYIIHTISQFSFVAILNFEEEETFLKHLEEMRQHLTGYFHCSVTLSISSTCKDYRQIDEAYQEAIYAMDYRYITNTDCLICYNDINTQDELFNNYPYRQLERLRDCFLQRDLNTIENQLHSILDYITTCNVPLFVARRISYDIINMVLSSLNDEALRDNHSYISSLTKFTTIQDLADAIYNIYNNLIVLSGNITDKKQDTLSEMKHYIQNHYTDPAFSLQLMAEYFGMSMTGLSQYFKKKSGQTLIEYYTLLRLDLAKQLLSQHKYKIDEIASMTGYSNTSSFIRRFKQLIGMSPGAFAQQGTEKSEN